jgi:hypothetical protein
MPGATRLTVLQAEQRRETQWHPRVQISVEKRAPDTRSITQRWTVVLCQPPPFFSDKTIIPSNSKLTADPDPARPALFRAHTIGARGGGTKEGKREKGKGKREKGKGTKRTGKIMHTQRQGHAIGIGIAHAYMHDVADKDE